MIDERSLIRCHVLVAMLFILSFSFGMLKHISPKTVQEVDGYVFLYGVVVLHLSKLYFLYPLTIEFGWNICIHFVFIQCLIRTGEIHWVVKIQSCHLGYIHHNTYLKSLFCMSVRSRNSLSTFIFTLSPSFVTLSIYTSSYVSSRGSSSRRLFSATSRWRMISIRAMQQA